MDTRAHVFGEAQRRGSRARAVLQTLMFTAILGVSMALSTEVVHAQETDDWWHGTITREIVIEKQGDTPGSRYTSSETQRSTIVLNQESDDDTKSRGHGDGFISYELENLDATVCGQHRASSIHGAASFSSDPPLIYRIQFNGTNWQITPISGSNSIPATNTTTFVHDPPACDHPPSETQSNANIGVGFGTFPGLEDADRLVRTIVTNPPEIDGTRVDTIRINLSRRVHTDCDGIPDLTELENGTPIDQPTTCDEPTGQFPTGLCFGATAAAFDSTVLGAFYQFAEGGFKAAAKVMGPAGTVIGLLDLVCARDQEVSNKYAHAACIGLGAASTGLGLVSMLNVWNPAGWGGAALSIGLGIAGAGACFADPPDPNFTTIAEPVDRESLVPKGAPGKKPVVRVLKAFLRHANKVSATAEAMNYCINRASGAKLAGDASWEVRQLDCASRHAFDLAKLYTAQKRVQKRVVRVFEKATVPNPQLDRNLVKNHLQRLDKAVRKMMPGATNEQLDFVRSHLSEVVESIKVPKRPFDAIAGDKVLRALDKAARAFRELGAKYRQDFLRLRNAT